MLHKPTSNQPLNHSLLSAHMYMCNAHINAFLFVYPWSICLLSVSFAGSYLAGEPRRVEGKKGKFFTPCTFILSNHSTYYVGNNLGGDKGEAGKAFDGL